MKNKLDKTIEWNTNKTDSVCFTSALFLVQSSEFTFYRKGLSQKFISQKL